MMDREAGAASCNSPPPPPPFRIYASLFDAPLSFSPLPFCTSLSLFLSLSNNWKFFRNSLSRNGSVFFQRRKVKAFGIHEETRDGINSGGPSLEIYERPVLEHSKETARKLGMDFDLFFSSSPEFRRGKFLRSREREREIAFHVSFSLAALRERAKPFIPGSLLKSRVSGTVSMVHDTSRKLNRSRGRVITSRLLERKKKKKAAVCWGGEE